MTRIDLRIPVVCHLPAAALLLAAVPLSLLPLPAGATDFTLQNDGYSSGQNAAFQAGFSAGEIGAVRLTPAGPFPMKLKEILFLFGGASGQFQLQLRVYDDSALNTSPGSELYSNTYLVTASDAALQSISLDGENIMIGGPIRVGIEMVQGGLPSIARDDDGNINASLNYIFTSTGWYESQFFGLTGDWIIRAVVSDETVPTLPVTWGHIKSMHGDGSLGPPE